MSQQSATDSKGIAKATGIVSMFTLLSRILGFVRDVLIARFFGAGLATDAFFVAFKIPNLLRRLVAEGSLSVAFVPIFSDQLAQSEEDARKTVTQVTGFATILTLVLSLLGIYFSREITLFFAPGFNDIDGKVSLASELLQLMFPYVILVTLLALATGILNTLGRFALPALAPALLNASIIGSILVSAWMNHLSVYSLAIGVLLGGLLALTPQLFALRRLGFPLRPTFPNSKSKALRELIFLMLPAVVSASVYQLMIFINTLLASMLQEGSVSWLYYADRVFQFPLGIFSLAIAQVILPIMAKELSGADEDGVKRERMKQKFILALEWITLVMLPSSVGLFFLAEDIVEVLFLQGSFDEVSAKQTALALKAYAIGLWPIGMQSTFVRAFLAQKNTTIPAIISIGTLLGNVVVAFCIMGPVESAPGLGHYIALATEFCHVASLGHVGLALALSLSSYVTMVLLIAFLPKVRISFTFLDICPALPKAFLSSAGMLIILLLFQTVKLPTFIHLPLAIVVGISSYALFAVLLRIQSVTRIFQFFWKNRQPLSPPAE